MMDPEIDLSSPRTVVLPLFIYSFPPLHNLRLLLKRKIKDKRVDVLDFITGASLTGQRSVETDVGPSFANPRRMLLLHQHVSLFSQHGRHSASVCSTSKRTWVKPGDSDECSENMAGSSLVSPHRLTERSQRRDSAPSRLSRDGERRCCYCGRERRLTAGHGAPSDGPSLAITQKHRFHARAHTN